jgi:hypothetical protein
VSFCVASSFYGGATANARSKIGRGAAHPVGHPAAGATTRNGFE